MKRCVAFVLPLAMAFLIVDRPVFAQPAAAPAQDPLAPVAGGITAEQVSTRAVASSYQVEAASQLAVAASERADQALYGFVPRVTVLGKYTRLSNFTPEQLLQLPPGFLIGTAQPPGTVNPTPTQALPAFDTSIPVIPDQFVLDATVIVPISDYFLRISKGYTAASHADEAAHLDLVGAKAKSLADAKIAYYTWVRARGAFVVAQQTLAVARAHLHDAEIGGGAGSTSKADVMRARTAVASAELLVERAKSAVSLTERQVRIAIHASTDEKIEPGESLDGPFQPARDLPSLIAEGHAHRPEIKSLDHNADAARALASAARAGYVPTLFAFGDVTDANPNPRRFPPEAEWFPTWAIGAQIAWTPTDILATGAAAGDAEARASALDAQKKAARDGIELEVVQAFNAINEADVAINTTARQLDSATEGYRVARELYNAGRGTSTALTDAEGALAQARFDRLNARVDAKIARVRLEHATGRDARGLP